MTPSSFNMDSEPNPRGTGEFTTWTCRRCVYGCVCVCVCVCVWVKRETERERERGGGESFV